MCSCDRVGKGARIGPVRRGKSVRGKFGRMNLRLYDAATVLEWNQIRPPNSRLQRMRFDDSACRGSILGSYPVTTCTNPLVALMHIRLLTMRLEISKDGVHSTRTHALTYDQK